jgi:hypothetical protein
MLCCCALLMDKKNDLLCLNAAVWDDEASSVLQSHVRGLTLRGLTIGYSLTD